MCRYYGRDADDQLGNDRIAGLGRLDELSFLSGTDIVRIEILQCNELLLRSRALSLAARPSRISQCQRAWCGGQCSGSYPGIT
jgi:hypothetical protein